MIFFSSFGYPECFVTNVILNNSVIQWEFCFGPAQEYVWVKFESWIWQARQYILCPAIYADRTFPHLLFPLYRTLRGTFRGKCGCLLHGNALMWKCWKIWLLYHISYSNHFTAVISTPKGFELLTIVAIISLFTNRIVSAQCLCHKAIFSMGLSGFPLCIVNSPAV